MDHPSWTLFLDTNCLLHYPPLSQIDWRKLAGAKTVKLCICMIVAHELDKKKNDPLLRDRANGAIKELSRMNRAKGAVRDNVTLEILVGELRREDFPHGYSPDSSDDAILVHALQYGDEHVEEKIAIVSEDLGMEVKCVAHGFAILRPDTIAGRLPNPADAKTKEHRQALAELERLKNKLPNLRVLVSMPKKPPPSSALRFEPPAQLPFRDIDSEVGAAEAKRRVYSGRTKGEITGRVPHEEYIRYDSEFDQYVADFRAYLLKVNQQAEHRARSFCAMFSLENTGGAPAEDVDVDLNFPPGITIERIGESSILLQEPRPPSLPGANPQLSYGNLLGSLGAIGQPPVANVPKSSDQVGFRIRKGFAYQASWHIDRLKHGYHRNMFVVRIVFRDRQAVKSFHVDYTCSAGNHPDKKMGRVDFIVNGS